ncbi:glycosyltransferase [Candidatus Parcubacteria bacterium]|nr:glycosyltransferase [Candidatus Parcubacteria bacterium]
MESPPKKKVLFVITKSNWGGAQRYVYDLATNLSRKQFEVAVALGGDGDLQQKLKMEGIPVIHLEGIQRNLSVGADANGFLSLYKTMRSSAPDVVHLNSSKAGGLGALAARLSGVPRIIFTAHGWPFAEKRNAAWRLFALIGSWATALLSHAVIVVSKNDLLIGKRMPLCSAKMHLIYNGIHLPLSLGSGEKIRSAFPSGAHITGTIGELTKNKNQIALIEQARGAPAMYVAIVGEGEDHLYLQKKIEDYGLTTRVRLFGFVPASEVLKGFDTFTLPSLKEGLPYVLLEAKAAGLPITANRVGGVGDIVDAKDMSSFSLDKMVRETIALYY